MTSPPGSAKARRFATDGAHGFVGRFRITAVVDKLLVRLLSLKRSAMARADAATAAGHNGYLVFQCQ